MEMTIYTDNSISIDGKKTGLYVAQSAGKTVVYRADGTECEMPHTRYSLSHDQPSSGVPGRSQFMNDILRKIR